MADHRVSRPCSKCLLSRLSLILFISIPGSTVLKLDLNNQEDKKLEEIFFIWQIFKRDELYSVFANILFPTHFEIIPITTPSAPWWKAVLNTRNSFLPKFYMLIKRQGNHQGHKLTVNFTAWVVLQAIRGESREKNACSQWLMHDAPTYYNSAAQTFWSVNAEVYPPFAILHYFVINTTLQWLQHQECISVTKPYSSFK